MSRAIISMLLQNQRSTPAYFRVIPNIANKRIFNATRAQNKEKLGPLPNCQEFLALNRQKLQQSRSSMFIGHNVTYFQDPESSINIDNVGLSIGGLLDAHDNVPTHRTLIDNASFGMEVVGIRHILILHARVQSKQVVSTGVMSAGGYDSSVYNKSFVGSLLLKVDTRKLFSSVSGLWHRTGEGLPLQWSEDPC